MSHTVRKTARLKRIEEMVERGILPEAAFERAHQLIISRRQLAVWFDNGLLALSVGLMLAGIVFFFAYNWADIHRFGKLGVIGALMLGGVGAAWAYEGKHPVRSMLGLLWASMMVGVFLAVFGQIYQTGADAWQLFAAWAGLISLWTLVSRSELHWGFWLLLIHVAAALCWNQLLGPGYDVPMEYVSITLAFANIALMVAHHFWTQRTKGQGFTSPRGLRALVAAATALTVFPVGFHIMSFGEEGLGQMVFGNPYANSFLVVVAYGVSVAAAVFVGWKRARDVGVLAFVGLGAITVGFVFMVRVFEGLDDVAFFPLSIYTLVSFATLTTTLYKLHRKETAASGEVTDG